jgi:hypothetical protein
MDNNLSFSEYISFRERSLELVNVQIKKLNIDKDADLVTEKRYEYLMNILITRKDEIHNEMHKVQCRMILNSEPLLVNPKNTVSSLELIKNQPKTSDDFEYQKLVNDVTKDNNNIDKTFRII